MCFLSSCVSQGWCWSPCRATWSRSPCRGPPCSPSSVLWTPSVFWSSSYSEMLDVWTRNIAARFLWFDPNLVLHIYSWDMWDSCLNLNPFYWTCLGILPKRRSTVQLSVYREPLETWKWESPFFCCTKQEGNSSWKWRNLNVAGMFLVIVFTVILDHHQYECWTVWIFNVASSTSTSKCLHRRFFVNSELKWITFGTCRDIKLSIVFNFVFFNFPC